MSTKKVFLETVTQSVKSVRLVRILIRVSIETVRQFTLPFSTSPAYHIRHIIYYGYILHGYLSMINLNPVCTLP